MIIAVFDNVCANMIIDYRKILLFWSQLKNLTIVERKCIKLICTPVITSEKHWILLIQKNIALCCVYVQFLLLHNI